MAMENGEDAEKMLQLYIYNHMKKKNLHEAAEIYAQEANLEMSQMARCDESLLTEWWRSFWPTFCSRLSNKSGANAQSSGQPSIETTQAMLASLHIDGTSSSRQAPTSIAQQDVLPEIATTGMSRQLAGKTPIIPNFQYVMQENHDSSLFPLLERNQPIICGSNNCGNVIAPSPAELLSAPGVYQNRTGKLPMNTISDSILGQSAAKPLLAAEAFGNEFLEFPPVELLHEQELVDADMLYMMPPSGCQSNLQLPATMETPAQVTKIPQNDRPGRSDNMELTHPVGPDSPITIIEENAGLSAAQALGKGPLGFPPVQLLPTEITSVLPHVNPSQLQMPVSVQPPPQAARGWSLPVAAPNAGEANRNNHLPPTGMQMGVPGPDLDSYKSRLPDSFLQFFRQTVEMYTNQPPQQF
ncbi:hypothetical protein POM88_036281 [Heracleum sosnowskyi]|uniref:LisH domain-containing protein n=1 Tax=Heracleum sosnowskyi TaxID=360622 RepID=A0AAD8MEW5_9APIA|nr:hypothetical protein POM88_036281 [Heracleum sosnowskyi]